MKISINQAELQNALSVVTKGVSAVSTLPILSGVLIKTQDDQLILQSTDLELSIQYSINVLVEEEGQTVVPGKLFFEIIKSLPDATIAVELVDESIIITCDSSSFTIKTLDPQDFPSFPFVEVNKEVYLPFSQFSSMVKKVARFVSKDESRAALTGVLVSLNDQTLKMVSTDSYRLAITETDIKEIENDSFEAVISGSFLRNIASLQKSEEQISLALSENQIVVKYQNTIFINRRIEGNFPNYGQLLPSSCSTKVVVDVDKLINAVKRISLLNNSSAPIRFDINAELNTIQISAIAQDIGAAQETIVCDIEGESTEIAFNFAFVIDGLASINTENVLLEVQNSTKPGIFKSDEEEKFLYLIMPVRIS